MSDFFGNIFFMCTVVGAIGWAIIVAHAMGYINLPKWRR